MTTTLNVGSILQGGRYKIIDVLGQGGFGITYLGIQSGLERKVAIKEFYMKEFCAREAENSRVTIGTEGARTMVERFREKFVNEARKLAQLNHTHIVRVIDVFQENDTAYYVMEYADGGSLSQVVKRQGALSQPLAVRYAKEVASALQYIHDRRMNHLDIKPGNIMLNEKGETIVIDFGMSKHYDATTGNETSTTPVGISDGYAPLEQYRPGGVGEFSPQTDIYALGATLYFLLTAQKPPTASDVNEDGLPVGLLRQNGVSDSLIAVVTKAMGPRKRDRYATAQAMNDELKDEDNEIAAIVEDDETVPVIGIETDLERNAREEAAREEAERKAREEAARQEAERKAREEAARQEAERKAREEAARQEAERKAREEAARQEAERKAREEAARREEERKAREEAARQEAARKAREETAPKASDKGKSKLWIGIGVASLIGIGAAIGFGTKSNDVDVLEETDAAVTTVEDDQSKAEDVQLRVDNQQITIDHGHPTKRSFAYTGCVDANGIPEGEGTAVYPKTKDCSSCTFNGTFEAGLPQSGDLVFATGVKYHGTFDGEGFYKEGDLTDAEGYVFKGTYMKGEPFNGTWYKSTGEVDAKVVNGVDQ